MKHIIAVLAAATLATMVHAQASPYEVRRQSHCSLAEQVVRTGHPETKAEWAWQYIGLCPAEQQIPLALQRMQEARRSTDLALISAALMRASTLRDGTLFREVLQIAGDRQATTPARMYAFLVLDAISDRTRHPRWELYVRMGQLDERTRGLCSSNRSHPAVSDPGATPLPDEYRSLIFALAVRVESDPTEPREVRGAARCLV
ncbi:MAG TPA: hypothetical protein VF665_15450 [Longimicrobium sp.]|jgi:hypothetical protein|uniref:hypothetical protein n=1 Tax=Longimicrobium sp. TaxID=2029185 RepID=UPI002ED8B27D